MRNVIKTTVLFLAILVGVGSAQAQTTVIGPTSSASSALATASAISNQVQQGATPGISVFGDSIGAGTGSTPTNPFPVNDWAYQLHLKVGGPLYVNGQVRPGDECLDTGTRLMQRILPQGNGMDPVVVFESVTNDISRYGTTTSLENVFSRCALNAIAYSTIPAANKVLGGAMTLSGGFAIDTATTALQPNMGAICTTNACTAQTSITTQAANSPICIGYMIKDGNGGTATFKIDGTSQTDPYNSTTTFNFAGDGAATIATSNGATQGPVAACFNVASAGAHTVLVTGTSATSASNIIEVYWVGTAPPVSANNPLFVYVSANPRTDASSANVTIYNTLIQAQLTNLKANGGSTLNASYADTYSAEVNIATQTTIPVTPTSTSYAAATGWTADVGVAYQSNLGLPGTALKKVGSAPAAGQYSVSSGTYTFNAADINRVLLVTYTVNCGGGSASTAVTNCGSDAIHPTNVWHGGMASVIAAAIPVALVQGPTLPNQYQTAQTYQPYSTGNTAAFPYYSDPLGITSAGLFGNGVKRVDGISGPHFDFWSGLTGWTHAVPNTGGTTVECWWHYSTLGSGMPITAPSSNTSCDFYWQANGLIKFNAPLQANTFYITGSGTSGAIALPTAAITAGTCSTAATLAVGGSGVSSTTAFAWSYATDPSTVTGYGAGGLTIALFGTGNTINVKACNPTAGSITPAAMSINVRAIL